MITIFTPATKSISQRRNVSILPDAFCLVVYPPMVYSDCMAHTVKDKKKLITRINRIKGQLEALSKSIDSEEDCYKVMLLLASCRGALNGLMSEVVEGHIRDHIVHAETKKESSESAEELIDVMKSFLK